MKKILLIDDENDLRELMKARLEGQNYEVITAADGMEGYTKADELKPDIIILDIMMPNLDGHSLLLKIKENYKIKTTPVIIITASEDFSKTKAASLADYILLKPFDSDEFLKKIKELLTDSIEYG